MLAGGAPQTGTTPQKNPPLGGNRQDPRSLADTGMASQGEKNKRGIPPWPKRWYLRERLGGGGGNSYFKGVSLFLGQDSKTVKWHKFFLDPWVWPGIINDNKPSLLLTPQNGDRAPSASQGLAEK